MLIWVIEIACIKIAFEVSALSRCLSFPRTKHVLQALHVFKYLEIHDVNDIDLDTCYQRVASDKNIQSKVQAKKYLYVDAGE